MRHAPANGTLALRTDLWQVWKLALTPALGSAVDAARHLLGVEGFVPPSWTELSHRARPPPREVEDFEPGWRHERQHREDDILPTLDDRKHSVEITKCTRGWSSIVGHSFETCHSHRLSVVQGSAVASLAFASASCLTHLPMWPYS